MRIHYPIVPALALILALMTPVHASHAENKVQLQQKSGAPSTSTGEKLVMDQVRAFIAPARGANSAVFMDITNRSDKTIAITGASTPVSARAELHTHKQDGGVMKMRPADSFSITGNGGTHSLEPGSDHIMLLDLTTPLKKGQQFPLTLNFDKHKARAVTVHVVQPGGQVSDTQQ